VSVIDLEHRRGIANIRVGAAPGLARVSPDGKLVVVSNRDDNSISIIDAGSNSVRSTIPICKQPEDIAILPWSDKAFIACSGSGQVAAVDLKTDKLLALLDVGQTPVHLALKPDGGELFVSNYDSQTISTIETTTNEVAGSFLIGEHPVRGLVGSDNSTLYVSNFGTNSVSIFGIDNSKLLTTVAVGSRPEAMAFSANQVFLLVCDTQAGDVAAVRITERKYGKLTSAAALYTTIPVGNQPRDIVVKAFMLKGE
jgi:YVTN family beta-propeller protein